jgi:hypothetical protein
MNTYHDAIYNMKSYIGGLNASNKLKFYRKYYKLVNAYIANHPTDRTSGLDRSEYINEILLSHINIEAIINVNYDLNDIHEYIKDLIEDVPIYDLRDTKLLHRDMVKLKNKYEVGKIYKKK